VKSLTTVLFELAHKTFKIISSEMARGKSMEIMFLPSVLPWQTKGSSKNLFVLTTGRLLTSEMNINLLVNKDNEDPNQSEEASFDIFLIHQKIFVL
jgi:hypothetical protein